MPIDPSTFSVSIGDVQAIAPCMSFVLFLEDTLDEGLLEFYERSMAALGGRITHYLTGTTTRRSPVTERARTMVPTWLTNPRPGKDYFIEFFGCDRDRGVTGSALELVIRRRPPRPACASAAGELTPDEKAEIAFGRRLVTILRVCLPLDHELAAPDKFVEWVLGFQLVKAWPFVSGYAGLALNHYSTISATNVLRVMHMKMASFSLRYPGLDWLDTGSVANRVLRYRQEIRGFLPLIRRVNWLTLLSNRSVDYLGGSGALLQQIGTDMPITARPQEHGLVIQSEPEPRLGDVAHRDFIPAYRRVAAALRTVRMENIEGPGTGFSDEAANEWLNAFDRNYD